MVLFYQKRKGVVENVHNVVNDGQMTELQVKYFEEMLWYVTHYKSSDQVHFKLTHNYWKRIYTVDITYSIFKMTKFNVDGP